MATRGVKREAVSDISPAAQRSRGPSTTASTAATTSVKVASSGEDAVPEKKSPGKPRAKKLGRKDWSEEEKHRCLMHILIDSDLKLSSKTAAELKNLTGRTSDSVSHWWRSVLKDIREAKKARDGA